MRRRGGFLIKALSVAVLGAAVTAPLSAAGFSIFEQGAKAMGMAGAFTAQADDPSALFHNVGGIALQNDRGFSIGATWIHGLEAEFEGDNPFPGTGYTAEQEKLSEFPPHAYYVQPINTRWKFGLGVMTPFGLTTEWEDPNQFAGRFLSTRAALQAIDVQPTLGWQVTPSFGLGFGAIARFSSVELNRNVPRLNPFTQRVADIGSLKLEADTSEGYGWTVGVLHKYNNSFSWGLSYRSKIKIEYEGDARLTQILTGNVQFDTAVRAAAPFDVALPVETEIEFPDEASLGLAFALSPNLLLETDVNWTGWSSFEQVPIDFTGGATNSLPDQRLTEQWDDVFNYRAGLRWTLASGNQVRFGYVYDETPQPEEGISPLLPDANRNGITLGYGMRHIDLAVMYLVFDERSRNRNFPREEASQFFGTYNTRALLVGATLNF
jgi:long-chain fatty acid transport protein